MLISDSFTPESLDAVFLPIEQASGLPNACYTDPALFEFEREQVMARNWVAVSFADSLENNTVSPVDFMGIPILLSRSREGQIRVFHNVCSHRGLRLVEEHRKTNGRVVCPYHAWTYSMDGHLVATPNIGGVGVDSAPGFNCEGKGLKEIRSHVWMGTVFINLDGQAPAFGESMKPVIGRTLELMGESGMSLMKVSGEDRIGMEVRSNWKLIVENFLEAYHLPVIHPALNSYSPLKDHHCRIYGRNMAGQWTTTFNPSLGCEHPLPVFPDWNREQLMIGDYPAVYPNLLMGLQVNHVFLGILHPVEVDRTREEFQIFYCDEEALDDVYEETRTGNLSAWSKVFREDIEPCERMQAGRRSPGYRGGAFSPALDICSHHFHQWIAGHYRSASGTSAH